ncbi:MAG: PD40 domain-containing protein, partial [Acidobacteria bacterium]|nr:PD40 domain-containing protein [Acidobacteriota bacterium]
LASLNHPNIATLYGLESVSGPNSKLKTQNSKLPSGADAGTETFLVMELVEGEDLAERIAGGPIPLEAAVEIGRQIAEGLEAAHAKGIVHRDLKPANVRITDDGAVKILDFGLAKMWEPEPDDAAFTESPTITGELTRAGTILGTALYLSPEQALGKAVDRRTDIWAFGCVLYEMLTGKRVFDGGSSTEILAHILEREPEWSALSPALPPALRRLLERCLQKQPKRRLRDAGDVALALEDLDLEKPQPVAEGLRPGASLSAKLLPWALAAAAAILAIFGWVGKSPTEAPDTSPVVRFTEHSPAPIDLGILGHAGPAVALSPDGETLVWVGGVGRSTQLYMRHLEEGEARPIEGTEGAVAPFFSPDGEWIAFSVGDEGLMKVAVRGGAPQTISAVRHPHGATWGDGIIIMGAVGDNTLWSVDPNGGEIERLANLQGKILNGEYPRFLPGSRSLLVSLAGQNQVDLVLLDSGEVKTVVNEGVNATYLPSGHLMWAHSNNLLAAPFDPASGTLTGEARTVVEGVLRDGNFGLAHYAVSETGTLAHLSGSALQLGAQPVWVRLDGTVEPLGLPIDTYLSPRVAPDGRRLLLSRQTDSRSLWLAEPERGVMTPLTGDEGADYWAIWTPDGASTVFNSIQGGTFANLWMQPVDRSAPPTRLSTAEAHQPPQEITSDGRIVLFTSAAGVEANFDIHLLDLEGEPTISPLLATEANEAYPSLSPDERWLAYVSDASGDFEVYVQPFPDLGAIARVSPNGGHEPLWAPSGDRIYYRSAEGTRVYAVDVLSHDPLRFGREELLFEGDFAGGVGFGSKWDIHPDGDRFLMLQIEHPEAPEGIRVIVNWFDELERLVPSGN